MRVSLAIIAPLLAAVAQASLVGYVTIGEARPDLVALVVVSWSLAAGAAEGIWWAFTGGLAADLVGGGPFGAVTLSLLPVAAVFGLRGERGREPRLVAAFGLLGLATAIHQALLGAVTLLAGRPVPELTTLVTVVAGAAGYTAVLAIAVYPLLRVLHRRTAQRPAFD